MNDIFYVVIKVVHGYVVSASLCSTPSEACKKLSEITGAEIKSINSESIDSQLRDTMYSGSTILISEIDK